MEEHDDEEQIAEHLREYTQLYLETRRMRETQVSDGSKVPHGSAKHVKDLEQRIGSLIAWRDRQKRGSEARANYARLINRLKSELASAKRVASKAKMNENYATEPDPEKLQNWEKMVAGETPDEYVHQLVDNFKSATSLRDLDSAKEAVLSKIRSGSVSSAVSQDFLEWLYAQCAKNMGLRVRKVR